MKVIVFRGDVAGSPRERVLVSGSLPQSGLFDEPASLHYLATILTGCRQFDSFFLGPCFHDLVILFQECFAFVVCGYVTHFF